MKRIITLIFIGLVWTTGFSQDWLPLQPSDTCNYSLSENGKIVSLWVDNVNVENGDTIYEVNKVCRQVEGYGSADYYLVMNHASFLLSSFKKRNDTIEFSDSNTSLNYQLVLNDTSQFIFDAVNNITAQRISKTDTILWTTIQDSVCVYRLSTADTIVISKSFGILRFTASPEAGYYELSGIQHKYGTQIPMFVDFFNFSPGDVLEYTIEENSQAIWGYNMIRTKRISFIEKFTFGDTLVYACEIKEMAIKESLMGGTIDTSYILKNENIEFINLANSFTNMLPGQTIQITQSFFNPVKVRVDTSYHLLSKIFGSPAYHRYNASDDTLYREPYTGGSATFPIYLEDFDPFTLTTGTDYYFGLSYVYGEGLGILEKHYGHHNYGPHSGYSYALKLTAAKTSSVEFGTFCSDPFFVGIDLPDEHEGFIIFPNPSNEKITLMLPDSFDLGNAFVNIHDMQGKRIVLERLLHKTRELDISELANGIYILNIYNGQFNFNSKLVIE